MSDSKEEVKDIDLASTIAQAFDDSTEKAREEEKPEEKVETPREKTSGRFAAISSEDDKEKSEVTEKPETTEKPGTEAKVEAPSNWSAQDKETFAKIPKEGQEFLLRRHREMEADYTRKTQGIAELQREYAPVQEMFAPHVEAMRSRGWTPSSIIRAWANVENRFMNGDGVNAAAEILKSYKIDVTAVAKAMGTELPAPKPGDTTTLTNGTVDPSIAALINPINKTVNEIVARIQKDDRDRTQRETSEQTSRINQIVSEINQFANEKDKSGQLLRPYYSEVENKMAQLATAYRQAGQDPPKLQDLYDEAVWATPSTRQKLLTAQSQAEEKKRTAEARATAEKARKAGSSVSGGPGASSPRRSTPERSLRDELESNLADQEDRV